MKRIPLTRIASIVPIRDFLLRTGADVDDVMRSAALPSAVFDDHELLVPYPVVTRFLDRAGDTLDGETLGARAGHATPLESLGIFGRRVATSTTLADALMTAMDGAPAYSGESFWLTHVGNDVRLHHRFPLRLDDRHQQAEQLSLCIALRFLKSIAAPAWQPRVHLKKGMPRAIADLPMLRTSAIVFDQPTWAITFPRTLLPRRLPAPKTAAPRPAVLERWLASAPGSDLVTTLTQVIGTALVTGDAGIGRVAGWVGTSTRTLQRRLEGAGTSYAQILARTRFAAATRLLDESAWTVQDISRMVGYSDPAHFTRAFRRWSGYPPRAFRDVHMCDANRLVANSASVPSRKFVA